MKEKIYTIAAIAVAIIRTVIGAAATVAVVICAVLDRFSAKLLISAGYDRDSIEDTRGDVAHELYSVYRKYSNFS